jgi:electron transfer flavoprotein alpha/beta subunit
MSDETITIHKKEYERLQKLEAELPAMLEAAKKERDKERLAKLRQKEKENPEPHRKKVLERYHKNKDEILAKRREAYRRKKEANQNSSGSSFSDPEKSPDSL